MTSRLAVCLLLAASGCATGLTEDAEVEPGPLVLATYNAGLAHGSVPFADERIPAIIELIKQSPADVMCLQEVWTDHDAAAIELGVHGEFPFSFRETTEAPAGTWYACTSQLGALSTMSSCVAEKCTPTGISAFECAADQCKPEWGALDETCKLCIARSEEHTSELQSQSNLVCRL